MSTVLGLLNPSSFFCHDPWDYLCWGGVSAAVWAGQAIRPRRGLRYQSQKVVGRMERGGCSRRVSGPGEGGGGWLLFQPLSTRIPWKDYRAGWFVTAPELFPTIGWDGQADVGAAAGGSDDSSTSLSHCGTVSQHQRLSHTHTHMTKTWGPRAPYTHTHNTRSSGSQRWRRTQQSFFFCHQRWT